MIIILDNWHELVTYFTVVAQERTRAPRFKARLIADMLMDETNYLYFVFAIPVINEFKRVNALFQKTDCNPERLVSDLITHHKSFRHRVFDTQGKKLPLDNILFGAKFLLEERRVI